ncbi:MAG: hypothetical protein RIF41_35425, partial [Polyangiaceae bacterium]
DAQAPSASALAPTIPAAPKPGSASPNEDPAPGWDPHVARTVPDRVRPPEAERAACAFDQAVCVHVGTGARRAPVDRTLAVARDTLRFLDRQGLPSPLPDAGRGGTMALDVYLTTDGAPTDAYAELDASPGHFDRAPAYILAPVPDEPDCRSDAAIASAVTRATLHGLDAAHHASTARMIGGYVAGFVAPCPAQSLTDVDDFQRQPHRALTRDTPGSALFVKYLDERWGAGGVGAVAFGLVATSAQRSDPNRWLLSNEPDLWDALRRVMLDRKSSLGNVLIDFAVHRAFVGDRSDGAHLSDVAWLGSAGRIGFEWAVDYGSLPRRLAPLHDVEPTGSSYVYVDLAGTDPHAGLRLIAEWETSFVFQWAIVRLDERGIELGRKMGGGVYGEDTLQLTMTDVDGAHALLVVGTNLGHDDRHADFDPDAGPPRAAGHTVTLYPL